MGDRYVVLGLAHTRSRWFGEVARWSTTGAAPLEFVKCIAADEVRAVLGAGRRVSAVLVDAGVPQFGRDLVECAADAGAVTIAVDERGLGNDWEAIGCAAVLGPDIDRDGLMEVLSRHAHTVDRAERRRSHIEISLPDDIPVGRLICVTGSGGSGRSTIAMALAQGLAARGGDVALADGARRSDLAMYHDVGDVVPGLVELVDLHRADRPDPVDIRELLFDVPARQYSLLLGLCRSRDWAALRPRAVEAALDGLRRSFDTVVIDADADVEGEAQCGSVDVEERNAVARCSAVGADVVLLVTPPGLQGLHDAVRTIDDLCELGVATDRIVPVFNRAGPNPAHRGELVRSLHSLTAERRAGATARGRGSGAVAPALFVRHARFVEEAHRCAGRLPERMADQLAHSVTVLLDRIPSTPAARPDAATGDPIRPGDLGVSRVTRGRVA